MVLESPTDSAVLLKITIEQQETINKLTQQIAELQNRLDKLLHLLYGTKKEKQRQIKEETKDNQRKVTLKKQDRETSGGRRALPADLSRIEIKYDLPQEQQGCSCGYKMHKMGHVVTEQ